MRSEFNDWYEKWTGSKVKCENTDIIGAWQHQQSKVDELQKRVDGLTQVMEGLLEEMKYPTATFEEVICCGIKELEQTLKGGNHEAN